MLVCISLMISYRFFLCYVSLRMLMGKETSNSGVGGGIILLLLPVSEVQLRCLLTGCLLFTACLLADCVLVVNKFWQLVNRILSLVDILSACSQFDLT